MTLPFAGLAGPEMRCWDERGGDRGGDVTPTLTDGTASRSNRVTVGIWSILSRRTTPNDGAEHYGGDVHGTNRNDFILVSTPASSVPLGQTTTFTVRFDPSDLGARTALACRNDDADEPD
jgi:hypothetical protein